MSKRVLVRTDNKEFGRVIGTRLRARGAKVDVTSSLNATGNVLVRGKNPFFKPGKPYREVVRDGLGVFLLGSGLYPYLLDRATNGPEYDFVIFDPSVGVQSVEKRFLDEGMGAGLGLHCIDGTRFPEDQVLGLERNYLGSWHFLPGPHIADLPENLVRGLAFMQQLKSAGRGQNGNYGHPYFKYVFASDDKRMRGWSNLMQSLGFVDYSDGLNFERVEWIEKLNRNERDALDTVTDYLSSSARAVIATSALTLVQPALEAIRIITPTAHAQTLTTYSKTGQNQNEDTVIFVDGKITAGLDYKPKSNEHDEYTGAFKIAMPEGAVLLFANSDGKWEAKLQPRIGAGFELDFGAGSDELFHTGLLYITGENQQDLVFPTEKIRKEKNSGGLSGLTRTIFLPG